MPGLYYIGALGEGSLGIGILIPHFYYFNILNWNKYSAFH